MSIDPTQARILLVGPRVVHLRPFFERRRYQVLAAPRGVEGMAALDEARRDVVLLELNLGDLTATEFLMAARQAHPDSTFLLLDDASKAGQIVKALQAGLDGYLPTPPDEDRLFFEVERHLRLQRGGTANAAENAASQFSGTTQVSDRPSELDTAHTQLADRESALVEMGMHNEMLQQEVATLRTESKLLRELREALLPVLDAELDADQVSRLKDRLSIASVLETEAGALRSELADAKAERRALQEEIDALKRAEATRVAQTADDSMEPAERKRKYEELEADNMVLAGKVGELEEALEIARAEAVAIAQKHAEDLDAVQRELKRVTVDRASERGDIERTAQEHVAVLQKLARDHELDVVRLRADHSAEVDQLRKDLHEQTERLTRELAEAQRSAEAQLADARRSAEARLAEAVKAREADLASRAAEERDAHKRALDAALAEKEQAVEKALDIELQHDELRTRISALEGEVKRAVDRAQKAETDFKREKVRLIEEKEQAASGSHEAFEKMQRFVEESSALRRQNAEYEAAREELETRARRGDEAVEAVRREREQNARDRAELEANRSSIEAEAGRLRERILHLDEQLASVRDQLATAESALGDAGIMATRLADAVAARDGADREIERLNEAVRELEGVVVRSVSDLDAARGESASHAVLIDDLRDRLRVAEDALLEAADRAASDRAAALAQLEQQLAQQREQHQRRIEELEDKVRAAGSADPEADAAAETARAELYAERDAYRQRLQETEAWVQQAQVHLEAYATEREQLAARAQEALQEAQARQAETQELYRQVAQAKQSVEQLTARAAGLEEQLRRAHPQAAAPKALEDAQAELRALRSQLMQAQRQGGAQLPEEIEPLRWTLNAAIEQLTTLESREPGLGTHLRNLRLLAQALQRLGGR